MLEKQTMVLAPTNYGGNGIVSFTIDLHIKTGLHYLIFMYIRAL